MKNCRTTPRRRKYSPSAPPWSLGCPQDPFYLTPETTMASGAQNPVGWPGLQTTPTTSPVPVQHMPQPTHHGTWGMLVMMKSTPAWCQGPPKSPACCLNKLRGHPSAATPWRPPAPQLTCHGTWGMLVMMESMLAWCQGPPKSPACHLN